MPVPNSDGPAVTDLFGMPLPMSTGAPGSGAAPIVPPSASSREGVGAGFGQLYESAPDGDAGANPQYTRPGFAVADGYVSTPAHVAGSGSMPHPDAAQADLERNELGQYK